VCGGIAEYYGSDPTAVRLLTVVLAIVTGIFPMLVIYLVAAIVVPEADGELIRAPGRSQPGIGGGLIVGGVLIAIGAVALANELFFIDWDVVWPVALVAIGGIVLIGATRH
jgi:phage shock protein C